MKRCIVILVAGVLALAVPAYATMINVPDDQPTIQAGIDASVDGDTVLVQPGTYLENVNFNGRNIVLGSRFLNTGDTSYISQTVIDGSQGGSVIKFENGEDSTAVITGFTVQNGVADDGGGIYCYCSSPTIDNNLIHGNGSPYVWGGGIYCGGIYCDGSNPIISNNTISENQGYNGGGIFLWVLLGSSTPTVRDNLIYGNSATNSGGGITTNGANATIDNNRIIENSATAGGGLFIYQSNPLIYNNAIIGNSSNWGGGIHYYESSPMLNQNTIVGNYSGTRGGGITCRYNAGPDIDDTIIANTIIWDNIALIGDDEVEVVDASPDISYCDIDGGWDGEGNIDCNPMFCDPENGDFYLDASSCCVGAGEGGVDIGALGIGCGQPVPTLSEWGMIILGLSLLVAGTAAVIGRRIGTLANEH